MSDIYRTWVKLLNAVGAHVLNALEFFTCFCIKKKKRKKLLSSSFLNSIYPTCVSFICDSLIRDSLILNASSSFFSHTSTNSGVYFFAHPPLMEVKVSLSFTFDCGNLFFICPPSIIVVKYAAKEYVQRT